MFQNIYLFANKVNEINKRNKYFLVKKNVQIKSKILKNCTDLKKLEYMHVSCQVQGMGIYFAIYDIYKYRKILDYLKIKKNICLKISFYNKGVVSQKIQKINYEKSYWNLWNNSLALTISASFLKKF